MKASTIEVKVGIRKFCFWPMAALIFLRLPVPKWMLMFEVTP